MPCGTSRTVNRVSGAYQSEAKTDARDVYAIAETALHRSDFAAVDVLAQPAADVALLTAHRSDLVANRVRMINRLRDRLTGVFAALERSINYSSHKGVLVLLTGYRTATAMRRRSRATARQGRLSATAVGGTQRFVSSGLGA